MNLQTGQGAISHRNTENIILDTRSGKTVELETGVKDGLLVTEPDGHAVYFMQMLLSLIHI